MHHNALLNALATYAQRWPQEAKITHRFIQFVTTHSDCFQRTLHVGHITGSAWIVNHSGTHTLLTHHAKLNMWLQLGGHADGHTDLQKVALREAQEESGLHTFQPAGNEIFDLDIHLIPARKTEPAHYHYDVRYAFKTCHLKDYTVSAESHDLAWVDLQQMHQYTTEPSMLRMAEKWANR